MLATSYLSGCYLIYFVIGDKWVDLRDQHSLHLCEASECYQAAIGLANLDPCCEVTLQDEWIPAHQMDYSQDATLQSILMFHPEKEWPYSKNSVLPANMIVHRGKMIL
jgi:hypothetical protein